MQVESTAEHYEGASKNAVMSTEPTTPSLKRRIAAPRENFLANKKHGTDVELARHHSVLNSVS